MRARQAQLRMVALEQHEQDWTVEQYLCWITDLDDKPEEVGRVVEEETRRAVALAEGYYQQVTRRVAVLHPQTLAGVAFRQGMTFAAAALGKEPIRP